MDGDANAGCDGVRFQVKRLGILNTKTFADVV